MSAGPGDEADSLIGLFLSDGITPPFRVDTEFAKAWIRAAAGDGKPQAYLDAAALDYCVLTHEPFHPPILEGGPGGKKRFNTGPQFAVEPCDGHCDAILSVFNHLGRGIDTDVRNNIVCQRLGIDSGARYLLCWAANVIQRPAQRNVGLTLVGESNAAKSTLAEIFKVMLGKRAVNQAALALQKGSQFTGRIATGIIATIEELDCSDRRISERLSDWLTNSTLDVELKHRDPYQVKNCLHLIQTTNDASYAPVLDGDCRFTVIECYQLEQVDQFFGRKIQQQASAFLHYLLNFGLPDPYARLALPPLSTAVKEDVQDMHRTHEEHFAAACIEGDPTNTVWNADLFEHYQRWCETSGLPRQHDSASTLVKKIGRYLRVTYKAKISRSGSKRGRRGIALKDLSS